MLSVIIFIDEIIFNLNLLIFLFLFGLHSADYISSLAVFDHDGPHLLTSGVHDHHLNLAVALLLSDITLFELLSRLEDDS